MDASGFGRNGLSWPHQSVQKDCAIRVDNGYLHNLVGRPESGGLSVQNKRVLAQPFPGGYTAPLSATSRVTGHCIAPDTYNR